MAITGTKRENSGFEETKLYVGLAEVKPIAVNPDKEEYEKLTGRELKEDSKAIEYLGESKDGNKTVRIDFWLEEVKNKYKFKETFFLEDKERENKDGTKKQYINAVGQCSWADDPNNLGDWFIARDYRVAKVGEEELHKFMRHWLGDLNLKTGELLLDFKLLIKGNLKEIKPHIGGEFSTSFIVPVTVKSVDKEGEVKEYQNVYNKEYLPTYCLKFFRLTDYTKAENIEKEKDKDPKKMNNTQKTIQKFVTQITGEHGCKDFFLLKDLKEYIPGENVVSTNIPILTEGGSDY